MTYAEKLQDPRWAVKRRKIMTRDNFTCRDCKTAGKRVQVHHCHYTRGNPWDTPDELLLTLCEDCHLPRQELEEDCRLRLGLFLARVSLEQVNATSARIMAQLAAEIEK
jgi:5-methylcytosine-specific restriction endonuclease McrA